MNQLYRAIGTTKQNIHQRLGRQLALEEEQALLLPLMHQIREDHPAMGAKMLYEKLKPTTMGRDRFIAFYTAYGFTRLRPRNHRRTTDSRGVLRFPNRLAGRELNGVNQAFVSDITYYEIAREFYYLTFITDLYSRKIKGYQASRSLKTEQTTIPALRMLLPGLSASGAIFHSDGGGQYYSKAFVTLTEGRLINSMGECAYENPHAERINGIIKNDYLRYYDPQHFGELVKLLKKAVQKYNYERPHHSLQKYTPQQVEEGELKYSQYIKIKAEKPDSPHHNRNDNQQLKTVNPI